MNEPRIELEITGDRRPAPGLLKRVTLDESWDWDITFSAGYHLARRERGLAVELWATPADSAAWADVARDPSIRLWLYRVGYPPLVATITHSQMRYYADAVVPSRSPLQTVVELRCRTVGLELAAEDAHLATMEGN